ncbi:MAG: tetratricopeptide repeat protein [Gammaproteobacteria bacterium]|nr:tetratricopeptide repeat protein [Gammaproteobacteria bacterium]MYK47680.1 tetratricopeptide repeat protein [Gammaproteobacteria bacterium]
MSARVTCIVSGVVLFAGVLAEPGLCQGRQTRGDDGLQEYDQRYLRPGVGETVPDARTYKSLTPEEQRERTLRRKLRRVDELIEKGEYKEGAALLESLRVARSARDFAHVQSTLAFAYSQAGQPEKAIRHYERLLNIPATPASMGLAAHRQLARLYYGQGERQLWDEDAQRWFRRALSSMQTWIGTAPDTGPKDYLFLSRIQVELNDLEGGIASLGSAIQLAEERGVPVEEEWPVLLARLKSVRGDPAATQR